MNLATWMKAIEPSYFEIVCSCASSLQNIRRETKTLKAIQKRRRARRYLLSCAMQLLCNALPGSCILRAAPLPRLFSSTMAVLGAYRMLERYIKQL